MEAPHVPAQPGDLVCSFCDSTEVEELDMDIVCSQCGCVLQSGSMLGETDYTPENTGTWVPEDGANLQNRRLSKASTNGHTVQAAVLIRDQCAQVRAHGQRLFLPPSTLDEAVAAYTALSASETHRYASVAVKFAVALYVGARMSRTAFTLDEAAEGLRADRKRCARLFLRLIQDLPQPLPPFPSDGLLQRSMQRLGQHRAFTGAQVSSLLALAHRLLDFCRRRVAADAPSLGHVAACALLACEALLAAPPSAALLAEMGLPVSHHYVRPRHYSRVRSALADAAAVLPYSDAIGQATLLRHCDRILDVDECLE